ncbi:unnamed protein product [Lupinus luteus]|uniref:Uncharacterized protein n=1 Tax=Lupinus luteus TaxID=3873 RepID=A0AAV1X098_LUPLU
MAFFAELSIHIYIIILGAYVPLIVLIICRAGRLRGENKSNGRGYSHYALTRRAGKKDVMSVSALIRLQCIPIHSLCVGKAKPSALHCRGKGDTVPKGWLVLVTETDTDKARPSEIRSLRTFFLDMDQAPTSFLALARKRSRSPPTNKIGECIKSTSFIDGRVPTGYAVDLIRPTHVKVFRHLNVGSAFIS